MNDCKDKSNRFIRVAEYRTNKILDDLRLLGNCSNKANYQYSDADVKQIFSIIEQELKKTKAKFTESQKKSQFKLKGEKR